MSFNLTAALKQTFTECLYSVTSSDMETTWKHSDQSSYKRALRSDGVTSSAEAVGSVSMMEPLYRLSLKICSLVRDAANISQHPADHTHTEDEK